MNQPISSEGELLRSISKNLIDKCTLHRNNQKQRFFQFHVKFFQYQLTG